MCWDGYILVIANYFIYFVSAASIFTLCLWFSYRVRLLISAQPLLRVAQMHINRQDVAIQRQSRVVHAKQCSVPPNNSITAVAAVCLLTDWSVYIKYINLYMPFTQWCTYVTEEKCSTPNQAPQAVQEQCFQRKRVDFGLFNSEVLLCA